MLIRVELQLDLNELSKILDLSFIDEKYIIKENPTKNDHNSLDDC